MFARGGFARESVKKAAADIAGKLPPLHEVAEQNIQGGAPGEHYHLTLSERTNILAMLNMGQKIYEPVMQDGALLMNGDDCLVAWGGYHAT